MNIMTRVFCPSGGVGNNRLWSLQRGTVRQIELGRPWSFRKKRIGLHGLRILSDLVDMDFLTMAPYLGIVLLIVINVFLVRQKDMQVIDEEQLDA